MQPVTLLVLAVGCCWAATGEAAHILFLSPITAPSHSNFLKPVVKELANRGHNVTFWNGLRPDKAMAANVRQLYSANVGILNDDHGIRFSDRDHPFRLFFAFYDRLVEACYAIYRDPVFHQLMDTDEKFDAIVVEGILNECVLPLVHVHSVPFIYMVGISPPPYLFDAMGSPQGFDHFPNPGFSFTDNMNLWQRVLNSAVGLVAITFRKWILMTKVDSIAGEMLDKTRLQPVRLTEDEHLSLMISNTHSSINYQLPTSPAIIQAGGLHCLPSKPLPEDLESFVDGSGDAGTIIVSFGSILKGSNIPAGTKQLFESVFGRLSQRVVWKWEAETGNATDSVPANVKRVPWLPQQDLLGHPKVRLFITHGGLFSNQEAVYHGVPVIVLPVFADQPVNAQKIHNDGYGIHLDWDTLNEQTFYDAIQEILNNPRYAERMRHFSSLIRDQTEHPLVRAVYWIEFIIRHRGAPHLRTASRQLNFLQRGLVDVALVTISASLVVLYIAGRLFSVVYSLFVQKLSKRIRHLDVHDKVKEN